MKRGYIYALLAAVAVFCMGNRVANKLAVVDFDLHLYVDPSAAGGSDGRSWANADKNLKTALARVNSVFTVPVRIHIRSDGVTTVDNMRVNFADWTVMLPDSINRLYITTEASDRASTAWDTTKYSLSCDFVSGGGAGVCMAIDKQYVMIDGIQFRVTSQAGQNASCETVYFQAGNCRLSNFIIRGTNDTGAGGITRGISIVNGLEAYNGVIYAMGTAIGSQGIQQHVSATLYNLTVICGGINAINLDDGVVKLRNCYGGGSWYNAINNDGATIDQAYCASSDSSATGTGSLTGIAVSTANFSSVTTNSENWRLVSGSALRNAGTDLSGDATMPVTAGIRGNSRPSTPCIGADEYSP